MNHAVVADASVVLKWVLTAEEWSPQAQAFLEDALKARRRILAPPRLLSEVSNALHQRVHSRQEAYRITAEEAQEALTQLLAYPIELLSAPELYQQALRFGEVHGLRSLYDTLYVVLAQMVNGELWTADQRLVNGLGRAAPWLRWIANYPARG